MSIDKHIFKCPDTAFWHGIIKGVLEKGKKLVLFGGPDDKEIIEKILEDKEISSSANFINYFGKTKKSQRFNEYNVICKYFNMRRQRPLAYRCRTWFKHCCNIRAYK